MDGCLVCLLVLLFLLGKLITSHGQEPQPHQNEELTSHNLCTDGCLCWKELDKDAGHCVILCEDKDRHDQTFCQALENCRCDPTKGHDLICRKDEWSSDYPFRFLWYLLSQLVALFVWLLRTICSVPLFLVSLVFKLLSWLFWLLKVSLPYAFSLMLFERCIAGIGMDCYLLYQHLHDRHVEEVEVHRRIVIERTMS